MSIQEKVDSFLEHKRLAMIGVSRKDKEFSRGVYNEFTKRGYEVVPVNPHADEIDGTACFARPQDIQPPVEAALIILPESAIDQAVADSIEAGISHIWVQNPMPNTVSSKSVELCEAKGVSLIPGTCPHMFLPDTLFLHRIHAFFLRLFGGLN